MAEAVFQHLVGVEGLAQYFEIASAATGRWHVGERPHLGTQQVLTKHGLGVGDKRAQQISAQDVEHFDYLIAMDAENTEELYRSFSVRVPRLMEFAAPGFPLDVPDPYYNHNFEEVYQLVLSGCRGFLAYIRNQEE